MATDETRRGGEAVSSSVLHLSAICVHLWLRTTVLGGDHDRTRAGDHRERRRRRPSQSPREAQRSRPRDVRGAGRRRAARCRPIAACGPWCCRARGGRSAPGSTSPASWRWRARAATPGASLLDRRSADSPANFAQHAAWVWTEVPVPVIAALHGVGLRRRPADRARRRPPLRRARRPAVGDGDQVGADPRHERHPDAAPSGAPRRRQGADLHRPHRRGPRGRGARPGHPRRRTTRAPPRWRWRARSPSKSPDAIRAGKRLLNQAPLLAVGDGLALEARLQRGLLGSANQVEAVSANLQKRPPKFSDPA